MAGKSFKGNLEILNLSDIFQSLAMNRHSGTLIVNDGKREKKIYFAEGEITLLSSNRRQRLGEMLIASGKITAEDLDLALKLQKQSRKKLGEILVEEGFCTDEDIYKLVRMQIEEEIYDLFLWRKADFEFIADQIPDDMAREAPNLTRLSLNTNSLIMEALRRLDEWNLMQDLVPTTKEVFVISDAAALESAKVPERFNADLVDGKTTVEGLAERFFISEFELCKCLAELVREGAIRALTREELVEKSEEAYALNEFPAAAALYGRLAEHIPNQPKILIPLADSLRRTGAEKQALVIYDDLAKALEAGGKDVDRLRQCYEAITQLDPTRQDMARKLEELDLRQVSAPRKMGMLPVVAVLLLAGAGAAFAGRDRIMGFLKPPPDPSREIAAQLLEDMSRRKAERDYKGWFDKAVQLWTEHGNAPEMTKVELPILIATEPPGLEIFVNNVFQGAMSPEEEFHVCTYDPATAVQVEIKAPKRDGEQKILFSHLYEDPKKWNDVVRVAIFDEPDGSQITDGWLDVGLVHAPGLRAYVGPARDGTLRAVRVQAGSLQRVDGWDGLPLGEKGDTFSAPTVSGDLLLVGLVEGGLAAVDLSPAAPPGPDLVRRGLYPANAPVVARPVIVQGDGDPRVAFGTIEGDVLCFALGGGSPVWSAQTEGTIVHDPCVAGGLVIVGAGDARVYAWRADGGLAWQHAAEASLDGGPIAVGDAVVAVPLEGGSIALIAVKDGTSLGTLELGDAAKRRVALETDLLGKTLFVATDDGALRAFDVRQQELLWKVDFKRPSRLRPTLARFGERLIIGFDQPQIIGVSMTNGRLVWQSRFPEQAGHAAALSAFPEGLFVATTKNYLHLFDTQDH
jgi:outer membrane protein assembly factor BamB